MRVVKLKLFFDESGKQKETPTIMGGLSIPEKVYKTDVFQTYSQKLRDKVIKLHWNEFSGFMPLRREIINVITDTMNYSSLLKFNVINYYKPTGDFNGQLYKNMVYNKLPERILYGLLRGYGRDVFLDADVSIEYSTDYEKSKLHNLVKNQLNVQALYRAEQFQVQNSILSPKGQEIGVELTDLILGVVRTIIINKQIRKSNSKGENERIKLALDLLKINNFYKFLKNIRYFEWASNRELTEVDFSDYLKLFEAEHI